MDEQPRDTGEGFDYAKYIEPPTQPVGRRSFALRLLAWLPMAFFAACLITALLAQPLSRAMETPVPVTGGLPTAPTLTPGPAGSAPDAVPEAAPLSPSLSYREVATTRIHECTIAFHEFFILERMALHRPEMITSDSWRDEARVAMEDFETGCSPLGALPEAPSAYAEADRWLKLAAGEVDSASARFAEMIADSDSGHIDSIGEHMMNFLEFTNNAEKIFDRLEQRREI